MNVMSLLNTDGENVRTTTRSPSPEHEDYNSTSAFEILQYLTCPKCLGILTDPITFQCGNSLCRGCLLNSSIRTNQFNRKYCPIGCGKVHSLDCKTDVILQKLTDICKKELSTFLPLLSRQFLQSNNYCYNNNNNNNSYNNNNNNSINNNNNHNNNNNYQMKLLEDEEKNFRLLNKFHHTSESDDDDGISSSRMSGLINSNIFGSGNMDLNNNIYFDLRQIKDLLLSELDCQICYSLFIDPITTPCGHSFCKSCITRSLDHNSACPLCRQPLQSYNTYLHHPINKTIYTFIRALYPSLYSERRFNLESEFFNTMQDTPMFVTSALVFPKMPCFLHIFEPKYRLMIRRCLDSRQRQFGMVLARGSAYHDYGTMLEIRSTETLMDGRSLVETVGTYKFRVIGRGIKDGYDVGRIERIDDISPEEEERIEREEIRRAEIYNNNPLNTPGREYTTSELIGISRDFIETLRDGNSPWLLQRLNSVYGDMPDDPSDFSYWVASVIPIPEVEKYKLLELRSVRERLKLVVEWITSLRDQWWFSRGCSIS